MPCRDTPGTIPIAGRFKSTDERAADRTEHPDPDATCGHGPSPQLAIKWCLLDGGCPAASPRTHARPSASRREAGHRITNSECSRRTVLAVQRRAIAAGLRAELIFLTGNGL